MSPIAIAASIFVALLASGALGLWLRLPESHLQTDSRDTVKAILGLIATMTAVMLSMLIASAKTGYDAQVNEVQAIASRLVLLDRTLSHYGPDTARTREILRTTVETSVNHLWPPDRRTPVDLAPLGPRQSTEEFFREIAQLTPRNELQKAIQANALQAVAALAQTRLLMYAQSISSVRLPFLLVLVSWLLILFVGYGLFSQSNGTIFIAFVVGALSVSGAVFLILELSEPYAGLLRIPDTPLRQAIAAMGAP